MPLTTTKEMLMKAQREGYAIGAFNAENMEMIQAIVDAAEELRSPVIIQTTPSTIKYGGLDFFVANVKAAAKNTSVPIALHLDHGDSFELAARAYRAGYSSVMIDGSHCSFDENAAITKKVVELCSAANIPVEAELGKVGGKEDDLDGGEGGYTSPDDAEKFVVLTNADSLAVGIGTAHGVYIGTPKLDLERLSQIRARVSVPIVLHGASGLSDETLKDCISRGICKINFATELRIEYTRAVRETLEADANIIDVKTYSKIARQKVKELVMKKIEICGSLYKHACTE